MTKEEFINLLRGAVENFGKSISTDEGSWVVKGFIDIYKNIYTISSDTKVISKNIGICYRKSFKSRTYKGTKLLS